MSNKDVKEHKEYRCPKCGADVTKPGSLSAGYDRNGVMKDCHFDPDFLGMGCAVIAMNTRDEYRVDNNLNNLWCNGCDEYVWPDKFGDEDVQADAEEVANYNESYRGEGRSSLTFIDLESSCISDMTEALKDEGMTEKAEDWMEEEGIFHIVGEAVDDLYLEQVFSVASSKPDIARATLDECGEGFFWNNPFTTVSAVGILRQLIRNELVRVLELKLKGWEQAEAI